MKDQGGNSQPTQTMNSTASETEITIRNSAGVSFGHWIYIHRYPINTNGGGRNQKTAVMVSLTEGQFRRLENERRQLKDAVDRLQDDLDAAAKSEDSANEETKTLKENLMTTLKTLGVIDSGAGQDESGIDMAEYLLLEAKELCFARQSTLQSILNQNQSRIIEIAVKSGEDVINKIKQAVNTFSLKHDVHFEAKDAGSLVGFCEPLKDWFHNVEKSMSGSASGKGAFFAYEANVTTVLLRYMANASGSAGFELGPNKFDAHVTGKASAAVDLVKCEAKIDAYAPSKTGLALRVPPIPAEYQENPTLKLSDRFRQRTTGTLSRHPDKPFPYANFFPRIDFDFDSSFVKPGQLLRLRRLERLLNENPKYKVQIVGHTDQIGTDSYNMSLSERRARAVYAYIQNQADFWEELYSRLEPAQWGVPVLKTIVAELLKNRKGRMNNEQRQVYEQVKPKLSERMTAEVHGHSFKKALDLYCELYFYTGRFNTIEHGRELRLQLFADYMQLEGDIFVTRGRFHPQKLVFFGEQTPKENTNHRSARNRRVEFWLYEVCDSEEDWANFGHCRIHLTGDASGWAGASASVAIDLDAKVDASQLKLRGIPRTEQAKEHKVTPLTITPTDNPSETESTDKYKLAEGKNNWGVTREQSTATSSSSGRELTSSDGVNSFQNVKETSQTKAHSQSDSLYWDSENNALTRQRKQDARSSKDIKWYANNQKKLNGMIPESVANAGAEGRLSAFAGAKAEANGSIAFEWKSSEASDNGKPAIDAKGNAIKDDNGEPVINDGFLELAKAGGGAEGWAGAGFDADFAIRLSGEKLLVRTKLAGAVGLGAGVAVDMQVMPTNIYSMLMFIYEQLRKADYSFLEYISQEAWEWIQYGFTKYLQYGIDGARYAIEAGLEAGEMLVGQAIEIGDAIGVKIDENIAAIQEWWTNYNPVIDDIEQIAKNIIRNPHGLRFAPPDVKARLLTDLIEAYKEYKKQGWFDRLRTGVDENIEDAILCIFQWVQSKREFEKVMQRVGLDAPVRPDPNDEKYNPRKVFSPVLYQQALNRFDIEKRANAEKQRAVIVDILDWSQDSMYRIWLNRYLPENTPASRTVEPNHYLNEYCENL